MVQVIEYPRTATFAWSKKKLPFLVSGTIANTIDANFSSDSNLELWSINQIDNKKPLASLSVDSKFNDLDWSFDNKFIAGALDNSQIEIFEFDESKESITSVGNLPNNKHTGALKTVKFNSKQTNLLISGGSKNGEIFVWDLNNKNNLPLTPGLPMTPFESVSSLAWNKSLSHVFSAASNTSNVSIFDLKAKKEVIHLNHTNPLTNFKSIFSVVEWHPKNSTTIATATMNSMDSMENDSIFIWDLRNSHTPLQTINKNGHTNGILSLDWCDNDERLLLSSGRDNSVMLWNPETAEPLTKYPPRRNWCFKTRFAPDFPEVFATASFDGKIEVQTLQNLVNNSDNDVNDVSKNESETDFWNKVSSDDIVEKPTVLNIQAPSWYGIKNPAANWAFGGKLVSIGKDGKSINITKPNLPGYFQDNSTLNEALKTKNFASIINQRLVKAFNDSNEEDWNLLEKLSLDGKDEFLKEAFIFDDEEEENLKSENSEKEDTEGEDFFEKLESSYEPKGQFKLPDEPHANICKHLIKGNLKPAIVSSLEKDYLLEALVIALDSNDQALKSYVKRAYFSKHGDKFPLSRFLFSLSNKNVDDLVENLEVSQWKYIVKSIYKFFSNDITKKNELLIKLGNRLLENGNRQDALTVYLAANSLDDVAVVWLKEFSANETKIKESKGSQYEAHAECLTEFVERFTVFTRFVGAETKITNEDLISKFLEFVNLTSASGNFELAYKFLETLPGENEEVNTEKERVLLTSGISLNKQTRQQKNGPNINNSYNDVLSGASSFSSNIPLPSTQVNLPSTSFQPTYGTPQVQQQTQVNVPVAQVPAQPVPSYYSPIVPSHTTPAMGQSSKYTPLTATAPMVSGHPDGLKSGKAQQQQYFQAPINPYATTVQPTQPVFAHLNSANLTNKDPSSIPPPPTNMRSGQTPHLSKESNIGWNDLPLSTKEQRSRAKAVAVSPAVSTSNKSQQHIQMSIGNMPPPPPLSRTSSQAFTQPQQNIRGSRAASYASPKIPANPYAPYMNQSPSTSSAPLFNPYAPPSNPTSGDDGLTMNPYSTNSMPGMAPPASVVAQPVAPPPINARKKSHSESVVNNAGDLLDSIQSRVQDAPSRSPIDNTIPEDLTFVAPGVPVEQQPIVDFFKEEINRVAPLIPSEYTKQLKDCNKRLKILFQHLENQDLVKPDTINKLNKLIAFMKEKKYSDAMDVHIDIATNNAQEGGNWLTGIKRLIGIAEATG